MGAAREKVSRQHRGRATIGLRPPARPATSQGQMGEGADTSKKWRGTKGSDVRLREQSHFKFGEINRLGSGGGGPNLLIFFFGKNFSEIAKKKSGLRPKNKGGPKIEKKGRFLA